MNERNQEKKKNAQKKNVGKLKEKWNEINI